MAGDDAHVLDLTVTEFGQRRDPGRGTFALLAGPQAQQSLQPSVAAPTVRRTGQVATDPERILTHGASMWMIGQTATSGLFCHAASSSVTAPVT